MRMVVFRELPRTAHLDAPINKPPADALSIQGKLACSLDIG
jgi:hypothetical protein